MTMLETVLLLKSRARSFLRNETGVVAWEYLLVIAAVSVAVIFAVAYTPPTIFTAVTSGTCEAMNTVFPVPTFCAF